MNQILFSLNNNLILTQKKCNFLKMKFGGHQKYSIFVKES
jgi:hypothetical protein